MQISEVPMRIDIIVRGGMSRKMALESGGDSFRRVAQRWQSLGIEEYEFCHVEQTGPAVEQSIRHHGFHIIEIQECG